jgi:hypothetical protein
VVVASEGISITLKCKTKGSPRPKITWYKDDELLGICEGGNSRECQSFTRRNTEFKKNSITLHHLSSRNSGQYTCEVENLMGKSSSSARMTIFSKYARVDSMLHTRFNIICLHGVRQPSGVPQNLSAEKRPWVRGWEYTCVYWLQSHGNAHNLLMLRLGMEQRMAQFCKNLTMRVYLNEGGYYLQYGHRIYIPWKGKHNFFLLVSINEC